MKIFIVRHGETDFNKKGRPMGQRIDAPLNNLGVNQSKKIARDLVDKNIDIIFSSPLKRAEQTAEVINKFLSVKIIIDDRLKERDFGTLSGEKWENIEKYHCQSAHIDDRAQRYDYRAFGGESVKDVGMRLLDFIDEIKKNYKDKNILLVAHGGIIRLMERIFEKNTDPGVPKNGGLYFFNI